MVTVKKSLTVRTGGSATPTPSIAKPTENVAELIRGRNVTKLTDVCKVLSHPGLNDSFLLATLQAVQETISSFDRSLQFFIQVLFKVEWTTKQRETRNVYRKTMLEFVAAHNWCLKDVLAALIGKLRSTRFTIASLDSVAVQHGTAKLRSDEAVFGEIHESLVELGRLVPLSPTFHVETIEQLAPYALNGQQLMAQFAYARNALRLGDTFVQNRKGVLNWYLSTLLQIDLNVTVTSKSAQRNAVQASETTGEVENDFFRQVSFVSHQSTTCANLYETGDVLEFLQKFYDAPTTPSVAPKDGANVTPSASTFAKLSTDELNTIKLDLLLSLLFDYFETVAKRSALSTCDANISAPTTLLKAGSKRKRSDSQSSARDGELGTHAPVHTALLEMFDEFLAVFERQVLALNGHPTCVQFIVLWLCSLLSDTRKAHPKATRHSHRLEMANDLCTRFCAFLWSKFEQPAENLFVRCNSVHYLADFLARFADEEQHVSPRADLVRHYLARLCEFAHGYASRVAKENDTVGTPLENAKRHAVYYAAVRSAAYLLAYRHDVLLDDVTFLTTLRLQSLVTASLNPLLFCDSQLVAHFARVAHAVQIAYVDNVLERNRRLLHTLALSTAQTAADGTHLEVGTHQLAAALGFDSTFPFRSMPLVRFASTPRLIEPAATPITTSV